jgi:hypothetical protein
MNIASITDAVMIRRCGTVAVPDIGQYPGSVGSGRGNIILDVRFPVFVPAY